jgi:hypothetical protein
VHACTDFEWGDAASNSLTEADKLTRGHENATSLPVDVNDQEEVGRLVSGADVVIR